MIHLSCLVYFSFVQFCKILKANIQTLNNIVLAKRNNNKIITQYKDNIILNWPKSA